MLRVMLKHTSRSGRAPDLPIHRSKPGIREILLNGYDAIQRTPFGKSSLDLVSHLKKSLK